MTRENVEIVRGWTGHFRHTGEPDVSCLHPEFEVRDHDIPDSPVHRGAEGFRRWAEEWASAWEAYEIEPEEYLDAGNRVVEVVRMRAVGRSSGVSLDRQDAVIYTLSDGKIIGLDYFNNRAEALAAAGIAGDG